MSDQDLQAYEVQNLQAKQNSNHEVIVKQNPNPNHEVIMPDQASQVKQQSPATGFNHSFDVGIAMQCGTDAACIYNHLLYWLTHNRIQGLNLHEGRTWSYDSAEAIQEYLPYLTTAQIRNGLHNLLNEKIILKNNFHKNKIDRTCWYALNDEAPLKHSKRVYGVAKTANAFVEPNSRVESASKLAEKIVWG